MPLGNIFASDHGVSRVPVTMRTHEREEQERNQNLVRDSKFNI